MENLVWSFSNIAANVFKVRFPRRTLFILINDFFGLSGQVKMTFSNMTLQGQVSAKLSAPFSRNKPSTVNSFVIVLFVWNPSMNIISGHSALSCRNGKERRSRRKRKMLHSEIAAVKFLIEYSQKVQRKFAQAEINSKCSSQHDTLKTAEKSNWK